MGTFEKLGILVIVVIIVMILAVAISQWGGMGAEGLDAAAAGAVPAEILDPLTIRNIPEMGERYADPAAEEEEPADDPASDMWPGGIPKVYVIRPGDMVWKLVVKEWGLKDTFIAAVAAANPRTNMRRLKAGERLVIPDPRAYFRTRAEPAPKAKPGTRAYEVQTGDTLELIALKHLGAKARWPKIVAVNEGLKPHRLSPGQVIYLPVK